MGCCSLSNADVRVSKSTPASRAPCRVADKPEDLSAKQLRRKDDVDTVWTRTSGFLVPVSCLHSVMTPGLAASDATLVHQRLVSPQNIPYQPLPGEVAHDHPRLPLVSGLVALLKPLTSAVVDA